MITLAIDTCLDACSVALFDSDGGAVLAARHEPMSRGHAECLLPFVDQVFRESGLAPAALQQVIATRGPGTFTGVRVGLSAARGLAIEPGVKLSAISSLRALALCAADDGGPDLPILAAIDARREELYVATFSRSGDPETAPRIVRCSPDAASPADRMHLAVGSGAAKLVEMHSQFQMTDAATVPDARVWGPAAAAKSELLEEPVPLYLRKPDAKPPSPDSQVALAGR